MKNLLAVILIVLISSCSTLPDDYSFDDALAMGIQKIQNDLPDSSDIAILDFKSDNVNLSSYVIEEIYDKLINGGKLSIMERSRTDTILMEVGYQLSGEVDDNEIINIGHQLGAEFVVTGQIIFSGTSYRLRIFAIDIEKSRRIASSSLNITMNDKQIKYLLATETQQIDDSIQEKNMFLGKWKSTSDSSQTFKDGSSMLLRRIAILQFNADYTINVIQYEDTSDWNNQGEDSWFREWLYTGTGVYSLSDDNIIEIYLDLFREKEKRAFRDNYYTGDNWNYKVKTETTYNFNVALNRFILDSGLECGFQQNPQEIYFYTTFFKQ
jgi:TolB-like protein